MSQKRPPLPEVLWFESSYMRPHAFFILGDGTLDDESTCGLAEIDDFNDEPHRGLPEALRYRCAFCLTVLHKTPKLGL